MDIHPEYLTIDETKIEAAITEKTTAILATHVFGNPCAVEAIETLAKKHNLYISGGTDHAGILGGLDLYSADGLVPERLRVPSLMHGTSEENFRNIKNRIYG